MKIGQVNLRPTSDRDFWGRCYDRDLYLWHSTKLSGTRRELKADSTAVLPDLFSSRDGATTGSLFCQKVYHQILVFLTKTLNEIHKVSYPPRFWQLAFGSWLYRHIGIVYEKYAYLNLIDCNQVDLLLLDNKDFYTPRDHANFLLSYCNDFGVIQLITQYFDLFADRNYPRVSKQSPLTTLINRPNPMCHLVLTPPSQQSPKTLEQALARDEGPEVVLHGIHLESQFKQELRTAAGSRIDFLRTPQVVAHPKPRDWESRARLLKLQNEEPFIRYLLETLRVGIPEIFLEYFRDYHDTYAAHVERQRFTHIVSEYWVSFVPVSLYLAVASQQKRKVVIQEHGASIPMLHHHRKWYEIEASDLYVTTGWPHPDPRVVQGGFACRNHEPYQFLPGKNKLVYISFTRMPYFYGFGQYGNNSALIQHFELFPRFYSALEPKLKAALLLRPRTEPNFIDTAAYWEAEREGIPLSLGPFSQAIQPARLLIIDHFSTGVAEILFNRIPCLILFDKDVELLADEHLHLFDELVACGVVHHSAESAAAKANQIYDQVETWWTSDGVQQAVQRLCDFMYHPPQRFLAVLLGLLEPEHESPTP